MKKFILKLLGDSFVRSLLISLGNIILGQFLLWILDKIRARFGGKTFYVELREFLINISIEDFLNDKDVQDDMKSAI